MEDRFLTVQKFGKRARELEKFRFMEMESLFPMLSMEDGEPSGAVHCTVPEHIDGDEVFEGDFFRGRDRYLWLRKVVRIQAARQGSRVAGLFDFGTTGAGANSGFESMLYVDRHPYQGVDTNHGEVVFEDIAGREAEITFLLWSGLEGGGMPAQQEHKAAPGTTWIPS